MQHDPQQMTKSQTGHDTSVIHASHDHHAGHSVAMLRDKFWLSFILTVPVLFWSTDVQRWFGYTAPSFPGSRFVPAILGTVVFFYGGFVFIRGAWDELADRKPGMMTLISMGIIVAFGTSLAGTSGLFELEVWWELASLITIMILGHWLEMRAVFQSRGALNALAALLPDTAERVRGAHTEKVPLSELCVGAIRAALRLARSLRLRTPHEDRDGAARRPPDIRCRNNLYQHDDSSCLTQDLRRTNDQIKYFHASQARLNNRGIFSALADGTCSRCGESTSLKETYTALYPMSWCRCCIV